MQLFVCKIGGSQKVWEMLSTFAVRFFSWDFLHRLSSVPVANHEGSVDRLVNQYASVWKAPGSSASEVVSLINLPLIAQVVPRDEGNLSLQCVRQNVRL